MTAAVKDMRPTARLDTPRLRLVTGWTGAILLIVALFLIPSLEAQPARGAVSQPDFPRLAAWWPGTAPAADIAKRDYVMLHENRPSHPTQDRSSILAANPDMMFMSEGSARELYFSVAGNDPAFDAERLGAIPRSWVLLQVGSTLSQGVTSTGATSLSVSVVDAAKFRVGDLILADSEYMYVTGVSNGTPGTLTVKRGWAGSAAAAHSSGTKVNAVVTQWPGQVNLNMTASCPEGKATGEFASPAPEKANKWVARRNIAFYRARDYDGMMIDGSEEWLTYSQMPPIRSIGTVANPNVAVSDYAAFDTTWRTGIRQMFTYMRAEEPTAVIIANDGASPDLVTAGSQSRAGPRRISRWRTGRAASWGLAPGRPRNNSSDTRHGPTSRTSTPWSRTSLERAIRVYGSHSAPA